MQIVLAVATNSPYEDAVLQFADEFARLIDGKVRVGVVAHRDAPDDITSHPEAVPEEEELVELAEEQVEGEYEADAGRLEAPHEEVWIGGPAIRDTVRELAHCDFGVVGKGLLKEPGGGASVGSDVLRLKQASTKPLVIVPKKVGPVKRALFVYTEHPEAGHALSLAEVLARKGVKIKLVDAISPVGRTELRDTGSAYLEAHDVPFESVRAECENCTAEGGPVGEILHLVKQEDINLIVVGGTRRGVLGRLIWPELAREVVWNANVPVLVWY
jgi:nucleotide-binding universal stress UspA family protein